MPPFAVWNADSDLLIGARSAEEELVEMVVLPTHDVLDRDAEVSETVVGWDLDLPPNR